MVKQFFFTECQLGQLHMPMHVEHDIVVANLSVCLFACLSQSAIVLKRIHIVKLFPLSGRGTTIFLECYRRYEIPRGTPSAGTLTTCRWEKFANF